MSDSFSSPTVAIPAQEPDLDVNQVKDFLLANPDFFSRYPLLAEKVQIPHQQKGTVSLVELQSEQLREKVQGLQEQISHLMTVARQNEHIYRLYAALNMRLLACRCVSDVQHALQHVLLDHEDIGTVRLMLLSLEDHEMQASLQLLLQKRLQTDGFYFGRLSQDEQEWLMPGVRYGSVALMRIGVEEDIGVLAIGSDDDGHFNPEMDTLLITQLQQLLSFVLAQVAPPQ